MLFNNDNNFIYIALGLKKLVNGLNSSLYVILWKKYKKLMNN